MFCFVVLWYVIYFMLHYVFILFTAALLDVLGPTQNENQLSLNPSQGLLLLHNVTSQCVCMSDCVCQTDSCFAIRLHYFIWFDSVNRSLQHCKCKCNYSLCVLLCFCEKLGLFNANYNVSFCPVPCVEIVHMFVVVKWYEFENLYICGKIIAV